MNAKAQSALDNTPKPINR